MIAGTQDTHESPVEVNGPVPPGDYKNEPRFGKLSKAEQLRIMAESGDVRGVLAESVQAKLGLLDWGEFGDHLHAAMDVLARSNPTAFAEFVRADILAAAGKLVVHAGFRLEKHLHEEFVQVQHRRSWDVSDAFDALSAKVMSLHMYVAKLQQMDANTQRLLEQTRKLRLINDKAEAKKNRPRPSGRRRRASTPRPRPINTDSRIGGDV